MHCTDQLCCIFRCFSGCHNKKLGWFQFNLPKNEQWGQNLPIWPLSLITIGSQCSGLYSVLSVWNLWHIWFMYDCMVQSTYIYGIYGTYIGWHNGGQRYKRAIRRPLPPWGAPCQEWQLSARAERGKPMSVTSSWHLVNFIHIRLSASQVQCIELVKQTM